MTLSLKHPFTSGVVDGADASLVQPSNWNAEHTITMATAKVLGRATAGTGAVEEISVTGTGSVALATSPTLVTPTLTTLTYGGVTLSNAVTGTGNMVLSASPTFTGTNTVATLAATTINAFTLAGTVSGGGNQINNVIIGTSTPLAGSFTTLSATGAFTTTYTGDVAFNLKNGATTYGYIGIAGAFGGTSANDFVIRSDAANIWLGFSGTATTQISSTTFKIIPSTTSGATNSGALVVTGGVGIGDNLRVANSIYSGANINVSAAASGAAYTALSLVNTSNDSGAEVAMNFATNSAGITRSAQIAAVYSGANAQNLVFRTGNGASPSTRLTISAAGIATFSEATDASAIGTAAVVLSGGLSVAKNIYVGGQADGTINIASTSGSSWLVAARGLILHVPNNFTAQITTNGTNRFNIATSGEITVSSSTTASSTSAAALVVTGGVGIGDNLRVANAIYPGAGIAFPATQASSADANTLDDYEEGSWVPTYSGFSAAPSGGIFKYIKVGKMVTVWVSGSSAGTSNAATKTITLPFAALRSDAPVGMGLAFDNGTFKTNPCRIDLTASSATAKVYHDLMATLADVGWTASGACTFYFSFTYEATA